MSVTDDTSLPDAAEPAEAVPQEGPATAGPGSPVDGSDGGAPEEGAPAEPADDLDPVVQAQAQRDEYLAALQRLKAEFDNYRRRAERDRQAAAVVRVRELLGGLLPVIDNLERAAGALAGQDEAVVAGVEMVRTQLVGVLTAQGVTEIVAAEAGFDPNVHEAIAQVQVPGRASGEIVEVVEKGYLHEDAVLRPARVVVAADGAEG